MSPARRIRPGHAPFPATTLVLCTTVTLACTASNEPHGREETPLPNLALVHAWSFPGPGQEEPWTTVSDAAFTPDGSVLVVDGVGRGIYRISPQGRGITPLGREGAGPGEFRSPVNVAPLAGSLVVWDPGQSRVMRIEGDSVVQTLSVPSALFSAERSLYAMSRARFLTRTPVGFRAGEQTLTGFLVQDTSGAILDTLPPPWPPSKPHVIAGPQGREGTMPLTPVDLWIVTEDDEIVAVHTGSYDVVRMTPAGDTLGIVTRAVERVAVQRGEADAYRQGVEYAFRRTEPSWSWPRSVAFPEYKPIVADLLPLSGGGFVVIRHGPGVEFPERRAPGRVHWGEERRIDLFGAGGAPVGGFDLPPGQRLVRAAPDQILTSQRDELGRTHLHVYQLKLTSPSH